MQPVQNREIHIVDCHLNNSAALQLIKDQTLEGACCEVEYQLNLCGGGLLILAKVLKHLSVMSQAWEDEAYILMEFYSWAQKPKESKKTFVD